MSRRQKRDLARIIVAAALLAAAWMAPVEGWLSLLMYLAPYVICGWDVLWGAMRNMAGGRLFDEKFLMTIATVGAFCLGEYREAVAVMVFYQIGEWFQSVAVGKSRRDIAKLMDIRPDSATVVRDGAEMTVSPDEVAVGETIIVRPGEKIPLDGIIIEGHTAVNAAALTGESLPRDVGPSERVVSGCVNLTSLIRVRTESEAGDSTVSRILELVENASEKKARTERFITRFSRYYTPLVVIVAVVLAVVPPIFYGEWGEWINRALVFLVVSCPCALVVSVPLSFFGGIGGASRQGVLIKGAGYLEALSKVKTCVFDKTGTLTKGTFTVTAIHPEQVSQAELLDIAAIAESHSSHPIAQSIVAAHEGHIDPARVKDVSEIAGRGVKANIDGRDIYVGNGKLMDEVKAKWHPCHHPGTIIHISQADEYLGHIVINDEVKPDAKQALARLKELGVEKTVMLTGDSRDVGALVAKEVGVDEYHAQLLPQDKVAMVEELLKEGKGLCFVGDGINDAPVLSRADVGVAMGALGSDAAIEASDVVLMDDSPMKLCRAIAVSRRTMRIVRQNIAFALAVKAVVLALGAFGMADMWLAVFADVGVLVLAILNAMRALRA
ncbi:MAG: heavy metal translocating P-type ATPase [Clostridia bacterium]|nr:heavy metal translocating P-type ATPase [Clostridia bacterium]